MGNLQINLADKLAWPFACFIGVLVAVPLALRFGKRGRMLGIALSIIAFFAYYLMVSAASAFGRNGAINPYLRRVAAEHHHGNRGRGSSLAGRALTRALRETSTLRHRRDCGSRCLPRAPPFPRPRPQRSPDQQQLALSLFNTQSCAQHYRDDSQTLAQADRQRRDPPPAPVTTPGLPYPPGGVGNGTYTINRTPPPAPGTTPGVTPPPIPTGTPAATPEPEPIFLVRGGETPPPIPPAGQATPEPTAAPSGAPDARAGLHRGDLRQVDGKPRARTTQRRDRQRAHLLRRRRDRRRARAFRRRAYDYDHGTSVSRQPRA